MNIPKKYRKARTPKQVLKPGVGKLSQAIQKTLNECNAVMSAKTIAAIIFVPRMSKIEYRRALNSLGAELRRGASVGKWRKVERGLFCSNADSATESIVILDGN